MGFRNKTQGPDFFEDFTSQARQLVQAVEFLTHIYAASPEERIALRDQLHEVEHRGDELNHDIVQRINSSFITPFDREDINSLANGIDDVTDQIYGCAKRITFYKPKQIPRAAEEIAQMVLEGTQYMHKAIGELHSLKKKAGEIEKYCNKLHEIESQADEVFQNFTIELFENYTDAIEIIKLKEIVNVLEGITDEIDHIGKTIKIIIVKYA